MRWRLRETIRCHLITISPFNQFPAGDAIPAFQLPEINTLGLMLKGNADGFPTLSQPFLRKYLFSFRIINFKDGFSGKVA